MKNKLKRNDFCHCGSGKKYKLCHESKENIPYVQYAILLSILGVVLFYVLVPNEMNSVNNKKLKNQPSTYATSNTKLKQPVGKAPPGKVWHEEHGHYHDLPKSSIANQSKIPDELNPNKVWHEEHGHYHDK